MGEGIRWTPADDALVRELYPHPERREELYRAFAPRTPHAVRARACMLRVTGPQPPRWTPAEDEVLRRVYRRHGGEAAVMRKLPHKTRAAIERRAQYLGILCKPRWTAAEDRYLREHWGHDNPRTLREKLRGRRWNAIQRRALMDLRVGPESRQGYVPVSVAAERTGFAIATFHKVLAAASVRVQRCYTNRGALSATRGWVEWDEAVRAVETWNQHETVGAAARARGICDRVLWKWLRQAGVIAQQSNRRHWRIPSAVIDRVIAEREPGRQAWNARIARSRAARRVAA